MTGDLTMHGVTKSVVLDVSGPSPEFKDPGGNAHVALSATTKINRKDFGLNWNKAVETRPVVSDEVAIELELFNKLTQLTTMTSPSFSVNCTAAPWPWASLS